MAEGEEVLAVNRFNRKYNPSRGHGNLLEVARGGWLDYMRRGVAYRAVRMDQPVSMEMSLLKCDAEEQNDDAQKTDHETSARFRYSILADSSHH